VHVHDQVKSSRERLRALRTRVNQKFSADAQLLLEEAGIPRKVRCAASAPRAVPCTLLLLGVHVAAAS